MKIVTAALMCMTVAAAAQTDTPQADTPQALDQAWQEATRLFEDEKYTESATTYFNLYTSDSPKYHDKALASLTLSLIKAGFPNVAAYFFIKTLQTGDREVIKYVIRHLPKMLDVVGGDLLKKYILQFTNESDYDQSTKNHFYYFLGKNDLLRGEYGKALGALSKIGSGSGGSGSGGYGRELLAQANYLKGTARAILGQHSAALTAFESCSKTAVGEDLRARCTAGLARTYYETSQYETAEDIYDDIPKASFVWTDILFEQAWNAFAKGDFNRTLGKLVTYRSPSLSFVFNPEVEVLRAQTFYGLCLIDDVKKSVDEFNEKYGEVANKLKNFLLANEKDLAAFYGNGKAAFHGKLHTGNSFHRAMNRYVRGPYFAESVNQERRVERERKRVQSSFTGGTGGIAGFFTKILDWRKKTIQEIGGAYVKNSMVDQYNGMLAEFDKISFIKIEVLARAKATLEKKQILSEDEDGVLKRGSEKINRRDHQYFWTFNGEFWMDELGDYVFALQSECSK